MSWVCFFLFNPSRGGRRQLYFSKHEFSSAAVPQYFNFLLKSRGVFKLHMFFMKLMDCPEGSSLLGNTDLM